jgi:hypothetical protein
MRKYIISSIVLSSILIADGFEYKGDIGIESAYINHDIESKRDTQTALRLNAEFQQYFENGKVVINIKAIRDIDDEERLYFDFNDFYYKHNFEDGDLLIGRNTRFWGAMEFYNHTDVFNTKDWLDNPFDYDKKIGAKNIAYTHYFDNSELSLIAKIGEENQKVQDNKSINRFLPPIYDDKLITQKSKDRPTLYLKYSGSGDETQLDYSVIYQNGYDEQRYLTLVGDELRENAYIVNKLMGYATLVVGETIYKTEIAYTNSDDTLVSDYGQISLGLEHTLYGVWGKSDLGLLTEYYRYEAKDDIGDRSSENLFADDITFGFRLSINDNSDSQVLGGVAIDRDNKEKIIFVEYDTRLVDKYKLGLTYQHLAPKEDSSFQELDRVMIEFGYFF